LIEDLIMENLVTSVEVMQSWGFFNEVLKYF
jgi:hypothetical protein